MSDASEVFAEPPPREAMIERWPTALHLPRRDALGATILAGGWAVGFTGMVLAGTGAAALVAVGSAAALGGAAVIGAPWIRRRWRRRSTFERARRAVRRAGSPQPIARAAGWAHLRGRVKVLRAVPAPDGGGSCAAWVRVFRVSAICGCVPQCGTFYDADETHWWSGRFAIVDETGAAVVDTPWVDIAVAGDHPSERSTVVVRDGDEVEVVGRVQAASAPDAQALGAGASYRVAPRTVDLGGTAHRRVAVLLAR